MKEDLLQFIWKFQYFNRNELITTSGETLRIIHPGIHNQNQGPDFLEAKIQLNDTTWAGNIEIHINSSHWNLHQHSSDNNFNNIILHVVWHNDVSINDANGNPLPTIELESRVSHLLLEKYQQLMQTTSFIPCENHVLKIRELTLTSWKQRLVAERLIKRSERISSVLTETNFHWEEVFWWMLASNFGIKVNSQAFLQVAKTLPVTLLAKHKHHIVQVEALLFGQAGLLKSEFTDKYAVLLQKEYQFYQKKYNLKPVDEEVHFLRMRPANFPTIRLAQLAMVIQKSEHLFSKIKDTVLVADLKAMFAVEPNDYWNYHYSFNEESAFKTKKAGKQMVDNIIINTIVPVIFSYGLLNNDESFKEKAIRWLEEISAEKNSITTGFENIGFENKNAFDSQALLQLKNEYCNEKHCLNCAIGNSLLRTQNEPVSVIV
jgi:hypothetical protein